MEAAEFLGLGRIAEDFDVIPDASRRPEAGDAAQAEAFLADQSVELDPGRIKELTRFMTIFGRLKDLRESALERPRDEERCPIDELGDGGRVDVVKHGDTRLTWRGLHGCGGHERTCARLGERNDHGRLLLVVGDTHLGLAGAEFGDKAVSLGGVEEIAAHGRDERGIPDVDHGAIVMLSDLDGGVLLGSRGPADEERGVDADALQFLGDGHHLFKRRGDQTGQADEIGLQTLGFADNLLRGRHDSQVGDGVIITREHHADDILADVVDVAAHGRDEEVALGGAADFLGGHEGLEVGDGGLHDLGRLDHLREEHLPFTKELTDDTHAVHQRAFDHEQWAAKGDARFLGVSDDEVIDAPHQRMGEASRHRQRTPLVLLGGIDFGLGAGETRGGLHQAVRGIFAAAQHEVFDEVAQLGVDFSVDLEHPGVDDRHVQSGLNRVVEEDGVDGLAHGVVAGKSEGHVRQATRRAGARAQAFDFRDGFDEIKRVTVVLLHPRADGQDVRIKDDVLRIDARLFGENAEGAHADADLIDERRGLTLFIECHDDHGRTVATAKARPADKLCFAFLEGN